MGNYNRFKNIEAELEDLDRRGRSVFCIGSSILAQGNYNSAGRAGWDAVGPMSWASVFLNQRATFRNAAVSGQETSEMLNRLKTDVLDYEPDVVIVQNGTNEINDGVESIWENTLDMYNKILASGADLVMCAIAPRESGQWDEATLEVALELNERKRKFALLNPRAHFVDWNKYIIDPESTTGQPITDMLRDGTHWTPRGAFRAGQALTEVLSEILKPTDILSPAYIGDVITVNPTFAGTSGSAGTGVSGTIPNSWRVERVSGTTTGTVVCSKTTKGGYDPRNQLQAVFTPGAGGEEEFYIRTNGSNTSIPDFDALYEALMGIEVDAWDGWVAITLEVDDQGTPNKTYECLSNNYDEAWPEEAWEGILKIPELKFLDGDQRFRLRVTIDGSASGTGTLRINSPQLRKLDSDFLPEEGSYDRITEGELNKLV